MRLAIVLALISGSALAQGRVYDRTCEVGSRRSSRGGVSCGDGFTLAKSYVWPTTSTDRIPLCTDDSSCVAVCAIGAVTGSATAFECKGNNGASFGTVTDPGGTNIDSFIPGQKAREFLHDGVGNPVYLDSAALDAVFAAAAPYTVIVAGYPRPNGDAYNWALHRAGGTSGNFNIYSGPSTKSYCSGSNVVVTNTGQVSEGYGFTACTRSGGTDYKGYHQYDETTVTSGLSEPSIAGTGSWAIGDRLPLSSFGYGGPIIYVAFYNVQKTATQLTVIRDKFQRSYNAAGSLTGLTSQTLGIDNTATTGQVDFVYAGSAVVTSGGLVSTQGFTNYMAAGSVLGAAGTDVGTPTVSGSYAGPFKAWQFANEGVNMVDDDAAAFEGREGRTHGVAIGWQNGSAFLATGASGTVTTKARWIWTVPGGTATPAGCDWTLTATPARYECQTNVTGSPTSIKGRYVVGHVVGDTGSIKVYQTQATVGPALEPPVTNGSAVGSASYVLSTAAWPATSLGGKYEVVHTPKFDPDSQWYNSMGYTYRLLDPVDATPLHSGTLIHGYTWPGTYYAQGILTTGISMTTGQPYSSAIEWTATVAGKSNYVVRHSSCGATSPAACRSSTIVNSDSTGTVNTPNQPITATMGDRYNVGSSPVSLIINGLNVYGR